MKKLLLLTFTLFLFQTSVSAEDIFYKNDNVALTECEYNFIRELFYEGYEELITQEDYAFIFSNGTTCNTNIEKVIPYSPMNTMHTTAKKELVISKVCGSDCLITTVNKWFTEASTKSYDIIGARFVNTTLTTGVYTMAQANYTNYSTAMLASAFGDGFGVSVLLPPGPNAIVTQSYRVAKGGTVYASYQHAKYELNLTDTYNYTISPNGYGGVFLFNYPLNTIYDGMGGVFITL